MSGGGKLLGIALVGFMLTSRASAGEIQVRAVEATSEQGITIIGDRELPKVLYIVPWKLPRPPGKLGALSRPAYLAPISPCRMLDPKSVQAAGAWPCASRTN